MTTNIFAFSDQGCVLAKKIAEHYGDCGCFSLPKFAQKHGMEEIEGTQAKVGEVFDNSQLIIFVGAVGIAVRNIAPFIKSKTTDPAVLAVDEMARFVIPLLSGHIGGANDKARQLAQKLGAVAVITTATDINGKFSVDEWATKNNLYISDMEQAKNVSATILTEDVQIKSNFAIKGELPNGLTFNEQRVKIEITCTGKDGKNNDNTNDNSDKSCTLKLIPRVVSVGMGCKKDTPLEVAEELLLKVLSENNIDIKAVKSIASIDIKKEEKALVTLSEKYGIPFVTYTVQELLQVKGEFTRSEFVQGVTGVDNVCERSAMLAAENDKDNSGENISRLIVKKTALKGVTVAISLTNWEVAF